MSAVPAYSYNHSSSPLRLVHSVYNTSGARVHAFYGNEEKAWGDRTYRKHYSTLFPAEIRIDQESGESKTLLYLGGDAYTAPVALINGAEHYLHRDHLGSILAISNASGSLVEERHFTPWGELSSLRMAGGEAISGVHSATLAFSNSLLDRGFTGHEHFPQVNLIHMNGRLYDPRLKHFLAPDNNIIDPYDSRYYDRFAYALNNPLMVTDLSGESPETIAAIVKVLKVVYALYKIYDTIEGYTSNRYRGPIPAFFAAVAIAGGLDATGLVDVPLLKTEAGYSLGQAVVEIGKNILIPEGINLLQQHLLNNYLEQQQQQFALNQESEDFLPPPGSNISNINTSGVMTGGSGPFISESCVINCGEPADGEDDSDNVPEEEEEKQWYLDNDGDGYHAEERTANTMPTPGNWVITTKGEDCDDTDPNKIKNCDPCPSLKEDLKKVFPNASDNTLDKITNAINKYANKLGLDTKEKIQHFMAQAGVESHNLNSFREYTNYRPERAMEVFKGKFNAISNDNADPNKKNLSDFYTPGNTYLNAEDFYNWVYADENRSVKTRLGNTEPGDGWKYRGRGIIQLTGRENYENFSNWYKNNINSNSDLLSNPSLLQTDLEIGTISGMYFFQRNVLNKITVDENTSINKVTYRVNSKMEGLSERKAFLKIAKENIDCN